MADLALHISPPSTSRHLSLSISLSVILQHFGKLHFILHAVQEGDREGRRKRGVIEERGERERERSEEKRGKERVEAGGRGLLALQFESYANIFG